MDQPRQPIRLIELWRIPAVIALVLCAIASRLALGAMVLPPPTAAAGELNRLAAAMVICGPGAHALPSPHPTHHGISFDDQLLLDIAEAAVALQPLGMALPPAPVLVDNVAHASLWPSAVPPHPRHYRPAPRAPPSRA